MENKVNVITEQELRAFSVTVAPELPGYNSDNAITIAARIVRGREITAAQFAIFTAHVFTASELINLTCAFKAAGAKLA